jgi:hypothetical protein
MARFVVYLAHGEWCVSHGSIFLISFPSREMAVQAALRLANGAVVKGDAVSIEIVPEQVGMGVQIGLTKLLPSQREPANASPVERIVATRR